MNHDGHLKSDEQSAVLLSHSVLVVGIGRALAVTVLFLSVACGSKAYDRRGALDVGSPGLSDGGAEGRRADMPAQQPRSGCEGPLDCAADHMCAPITRDVCVSLARREVGDAQFCVLRSCCGGRGLVLRARERGRCVRDADCVPAGSVLDCGGNGRVNWCVPPVSSLSRTDFEESRLAFSQLVCDLTAVRCADVVEPCPEAPNRCIDGLCAFRR